MLLRVDLRAWMLCLALFIAAPAFIASSPVAAAENGAPTGAEITSAIEKLRADPNLGAERKVRRLKWNDEEEEPPDPTVPAWMKWMLGLFAWFAGAGRIVLWVLGAILLVLLVAYVVRFIKQRGAIALPDRFVAPTHVRDLDIRPESLPTDIGAAAFELWERGEHRAALALLYRGLLSRLAHVHSVPIRHSSTEGECVELAVRHLHQERTGYVSRLVRVWQHAVYGGKDPDTQSVRALCSGFAPALDAPAGAQLASQAP